MKKIIFLAFLFLNSIESIASDKKSAKTQIELPDLKANEKADAEAKFNLQKQYHHGYNQGYAAAEAKYEYRNNCCQFACCAACISLFVALVCRNSSTNQSSQPISCPNITTNATHFNQHKFNTVAFKTSATRFVPKQKAQIKNPVRFQKQQYNYTKRRKT